MIDMRYSCSFRGKSFSPMLVEEKTGLVLTHKNEVGELGQFGKYKGKKKPYGSAILAIPKGQNDNEKWFIDNLSTYIDVFKSCGAEEIVANLDVAHVGQCNFEFSSEFMRKMASLKITLTISCYEISESELENKN